MLRASRPPRVIAVLTRMRKIHVFSDARLSKRPIARRTPTQVSCTTSSATSRLRT